MRCFLHIRFYEEEQFMSYFNCLHANGRYSSLWRLADINECPKLTSRKISHLFEMKLSTREMHHTRSPCMQQSSSYWPETSVDEERFPEWQRTEKVSVKPHFYLHLIRSQEPKTSCGILNLSVLNVPSNGLFCRTRCCHTASRRVRNCRWSG